MTTAMPSAPVQPAGVAGQYNNLLVEMRQGKIFLTKDGREIGRITGILVDAGGSQLVLSPQFDAPIHHLTSAPIVNPVAGRFAPSAIKNGLVRQHAQNNLRIEPLTPREREVLALIEAGLATRHIAAELTITEGTVKKHISTIFGKLGVNRRTQAVAVARDLNLLQPS
ncbi:MAG: HTH-type transcriptional regulator MalT [Anaerolineae bacterium]|nr:HTH-type transcriptional regulator MalT [Anaerolineae bacterium]